MWRQCCDGLVLMCMGKDREVWRDEFMCWRQLWHECMSNAGDAVELVVPGGDDGGSAFLMPGKPGKLLSCAGREDM